MASRQSYTPLSSMATATESPLFWTDKSLPSAKDRASINELGLELPKGEHYGLSLRNGQLTISGQSNGISSYRLSNSSIVRSIEGTPEGILIQISGLFGIRSVLLRNTEQSIPRHAVNHAAADAPRVLLDEYAQLRMREESHGLSSGDSQRMIALMRQIGEEYRKIHRTADQDAYRSTPSSFGESRGGGLSLGNRGG